ncbi:tropomyosin-like [Python bivittatus]|uniref:Tropomyosin-like n=1 Tax=Python bivittatus TaxID=176946 RepID=A0A9F2R797_PYTBI|nr:tropomyosin-like [Python bivittatus]
MGGFVSYSRLSTVMENLKEHSPWHFYWTWVRNYFGFILVTVILLSLLIIEYSRAPPEPDTKCPEDQATLHDTISQLEAENRSLKKQLAMMEKEKQRVKKVMDQTLEKTLQLLEKTKEEGEGLSKQLSVSNQSLVETRRLLEQAKKEGQSLQSQLEIAKEDLQKTQQQQDSCQKQLAEATSTEAQLAMEKAKEKMENATKQNLEKTRQLLEKAEQDNQGLQKQLAISNRTLAETEHLLEKATKDIRGLQTQLKTTSQNHRESQEHLDSCQNQLHTLEERLRSLDNEAKQIQNLHDEISNLQLKVKKEQELRYTFQNERDRCWNQISYQQKKCSIEDVLDWSIVGWGIGILVLFFCCVACCRQEK